ncbi:multdrug transfer [Aspergillus japonicus CBS 114.51]|uniref:Multdrug transfer n=1 Tax=Aspergillus japonicus CBS 114.51 TaxID=1448312 RepID=A0A8T8WQW8_ASPJA|nr:multdrug transfer [Aspergillus japonicus CBS 114.51]RAH77942.1 multdrug transfer [Aspergillus japonicus CBS 114.51]
MDLLRDSSLGQLVRFATGKRCFLYPEERAGFAHPCTEEKVSVSSGLVHVPRSQSEHQRLVPGPGSKYERPHSQALTPQGGPVNEGRRSDGKDIFLVDWYDEKDVDNPQNWSSFKKSIVTAVLWLYTFTVYCASAIYTPSVDGVMEEYNLDHTLSTLGLSLYILGYGIGPLIFSPISEIPRIGRNAPYMITLFLYVLMAVPTALTRSFPAFLVLRFLTGFLGSPCLATGGATLQDMYSWSKMPYGYTAWVGATFCAPALGPIISGFAVDARGDWRLPLWEILWMALLTFVVMFVAFPETSASTILLRRAQRVRKVFKDQRYVSQSEIDEASLSPRHIVAHALIRPLQITILDPAVFFTNLYSSYSYGVYYSFFEAFPLVYTDMYGFDLGLTGTAFLSIVVACLAGTLIYLIYVYWHWEPRVKKNGLSPPEQCLIPAIFASFLQPIGLFLFAWSSRQSIHWVVSMAGVALFSTGGFILFQGIFTYLPLSYPRYAASLFAANDFFRSAWAAGAVIYARPLFDRLGIAGGVSLLGGLSCGGVLGVSALYVYGARLRSRSKFAET